MKRPILAVPFLALGLAASACSSSGRPEAELTDEMVCLAHNENDPAQRDRCRVDASIRNDTAPEASPHQLPIRTGQIGD